MKYSIIIHKDTDSDYGVTVPDLPGCFSAGRTIEEAMDMAKEAIEAHLEGLILDKEEIPTPRSIENHDLTNAVLAMIDIDLSKLTVKTKRINITMPENVIHAADEFAKMQHLSRSGLLTQAVTEYIIEHK